MSAECLCQTGGMSARMSVERLRCARGMSVRCPWIVCIVSAELRCITYVYADYPGSALWILQIIRTYIAVK